MEHYLYSYDYALWEIIVNGDAPAICISRAVYGNQGLPKTYGKQSQGPCLGGNKESKKMQKIILKQQYENIDASRSKGLDKTYDRFSSFANQSNSPNWTMRTGAVDTDDLKRWIANGSGSSTTNALVVQDGICGYDWSFQAEEGITNFALMAYTSQGLSSLDSKLECVMNRDEAVWKKILAFFLKYDVLVKDISIKVLKNQLEEALKEKDDLKLKLENFEESSKNLTKVIDSQIKAKDKNGLGYDSQMNKSEMVHSVFTVKKVMGHDNH
ncbi:hypothetical protein Tco_0907140 [Tanacetum coccineum]|uniref:Uncharacterized protein n=1 Tax=Tanacetum coccineum TaxID=301880 RepID=A0ABQ5CIL2_9ASTR